MRRLLFILLLIPAAGFAQYDFSAGFEAGLISSHILGDNIPGFNKIGPAGGAFVKVGFSEKIAGRMQINYVAKGSRSRPDTQAGNFNQTGYNVNYIEIPISVMWNMGNSISIDAGLYYAVLLSQRAFYGGGLSAYHDFDSSDLGSQIGATWDFSERYYLHTRYSFSVLPISGSLEQNIANGRVGGQQNHCVHFMIGLKLGSGK
jgi:hypothetical protein